MNILLVRLGSLGDIVHALPVAAALRERFPEARIDWLVDARYRDILDYVPVIDWRLVVRSDPSVASDVAESVPKARTFPGRRGLAAAVVELRRSRYDIAFDLQGLVKSAILARLSGARRVVGFAAGHVREGAAGICYHERVDPGLARHVVDKNLALLSALGIAGAPRRFPLDVPPSLVDRQVRDRLGLAADGRFALINPGGGWPNKQWPPARYGAAAAALFARHGLRSAVLWGPGEDGLAREIALTSHGAAGVAPATTIADVVTLTRAASLMVSGDTGPLHLAAAAGTPIVGIYGPTDPARNGPWDPSDITVSQYDACVCHYQRRCRRDDAVPGRHLRRGSHCRHRSTPRRRSRPHVAWRCSSRSGSVCRSDSRSVSILLWLARPTAMSLLVGGVVAAVGEALRVWAAGHVEKGSEVTTSGPYRWTAHPCMWARRSWVPVWRSRQAVRLWPLLVAAYMAISLTAAIRTEEAELTAKFGDEYRLYRQGRSAGSDRRFSLARVRRNREQRAIVGLFVGMGVLALKMLLRV